MSENIKWGKRKQFMNGKYSVAYSQFLGYDKGMQINEQQAMIVRYIYKLFLEGCPPSSIATQLVSLNIPSPMDYKQWYASTILSILTNEKYKGDALLQKSFIDDYLTKKLVINKGELPQYYVTDGHAPIIPRETFDYTQKVYSIYKKFKKHTFISALSQKLICNSCGQYYHRVNAYTGCYWVCKNHNLVTKCNSVRFRGDVIDYLLHAAITILFHKYLNKIKSFLPTHLQHFKLTKMIYPFEIVHLILDKVIAFRNYDLTFRFIDGTEITLSGWNATRKIAPKKMNIHRIPPSL
jgi:hypothetical protein